MPISQRHFRITLAVSLALHAMLVAWFSFAEPLPKPMPPPEEERPPLHLSLVTPIAKNSASTVAKPLHHEPAAKPKPAPRPVTQASPAVKPRPKPVVQKPKPTPPKPITKPTIKPTQPPPKPVDATVTPRPDVAQQTPSTTDAIPPPIQQALTVEPAPAVATNTAPPDSTATVQYEQLLIAWLEKHKRYPRRAKRLRIEGQGLLRIRLAPTGYTESVKLEASTGNRLLDRATLDMAKRANPFPAIPDNLTGVGREFIVPVAFILR